MTQEGFGRAAPAPAWPLQSWVRDTGSYSCRCEPFTNTWERRSSVTHLFDVCSPTELCREGFLARI